MPDFLLIETDWRSMARWGSLPTLIAGDHWTPARPVARYVLRVVCTACHQRYLGASPLPLPQTCPDCGGELTPVQAWDLRRQRQPPWWEMEEDSR